MIYKFLISNYFHNSICDVLMSIFYNLNGKIQHILISTTKILPSTITIKKTIKLHLYCLKFYVSIE